MTAARPGPNKGKPPANKGKRFGDFSETPAEKEARLRAASSWRERFQVAKVVFDDNAKRIYLENLCRTGRKGESAEKAGVTIQTVSSHRANDPDFNSACEHAMSMYADYIHTHALGLMMDGVEKPIIGGRFKDEVVAHEKEYPTNLIAMELKRTNPEYKERAEIDMNVKAGVLVAPADLSPADWIEQQQMLNNTRVAPEGGSDKTKA